MKPLSKLASALSGLILMLSALSSAQVINEVQSTQYKTLQSADRLYYDWIEIYNPTDAAIDLSGYGLSDSKKNPFKWAFPTNTTLAAQGYMVVFASGLDKRVTQIDTIYEPLTEIEEESAAEPLIVSIDTTVIEIHTNFKLASEGETLRLFDLDGTEINSVKIPALPAEISWQRTSDGATSWALNHRPTPGASNIPSYITSKATPPTFSHKGGFYTSAENLKLELSTPTGEIRYTLDGTEPTESSTLYTKSIALDQTKFIRARAFNNNQLPSLVVSHSYFVDTTFTVPVVSIIMDDFDLNDYEHGIYQLGPKASSNNPHYGANFWQAWEKPANIEFFEGDTQAISQYIGIAIQGKYSRSYRQKSFKVHSRESYGVDYLHYNFFANRPFNQYKSIVLRAGSTNWGGAGE